jgi:hypothetical protein
VDEAVGAVVLGAEEEKETLETPMVPKDVNDASVNTALMSSLRPVDRVAAAALDVVVSSDSTCSRERGHNLDSTCVWAKPSQASNTHKLRRPWEHLHAAAQDGHNRDVGSVHPRVRGELRQKSCLEGGREGGVVKRRDIQIGEGSGGGYCVESRGGRHSRRECSRRRSRRGGGRHSRRDCGGRHTGRPRGRHTRRLRRSHAGSLRGYSTRRM